MGMTPRPIDTEIARVKAAVERAESKLNALSKRARGACCPSCMFGERYDVPADAQERRLGWLAILLEKRGWPGDADLARAIRKSTWP